MYIVGVVSLMNLLLKLGNSMLRCDFFIIIIKCV